MPLVDRSIDDFVERQSRRIREEIELWENFKSEHQTGAYYAFTEQHRDGQIYTSGNEFKPDHEENLREYVELPDVVEINNILVDLNSIQIPYHCMHKSCRLTGKYCCKVTSCTGNTDKSKEVMREAGRFFIDKYNDEERISAIRQGNTHTPKLQHNRRIDGHCVFGEERTDENPDTGEEHLHIHCNLHEAAYENDIPLHYFHSIGPSLFPADILILDGQWFITAASKRAKENYITRWYVTSDDTICTNHGDSSNLAILQHPDYNDLYRDILGDQTVDAIQKEAYGEVGPIEPEISDGWIHAEERGLEEYSETCRNCSGDGCEKCDWRGYFTNWQ